MSKQALVNYRKIVNEVDGNNRNHHPGDNNDQGNDPPHQQTEGHVSADGTREKLNLLLQQTTPSHRRLCRLYSHLQGSIVARSSQRSQPEM